MTSTRWPYLAETMLVGFQIALFVFAALIPTHGLGAQRTANLTTGIRPTSHQPDSPAALNHLRIPGDEPSAAPYVLVGALVGAAIAGLWEANAISKNGDDFAGTGGLLWIPPAAGAVVGGFGGWLVFKIAHSGPRY